MVVARRKRSLSILSIVIAIAVLFASFWLYSIFRTMGENVGFDRSDVVFVSALVIAPGVAIAAGAATLGWTLGMSRSAVLTSVGSIVAASLLGVVLSETMILMDERAFVGEANDAGQQGHLRYWRARAWPNTGCALVWSYDSGIHATD